MTALLTVIQVVFTAITVGTWAVGALVIAAVVSAAVS